MLACLFHVAAPAGGLEPDELRADVLALARYFAPAGARPQWSAVRLLVHWPGHAVGWIGTSAEEHERLERTWQQRSTIWWGEPPPEVFLASPPAARDPMALTGCSAVFAEAREAVEILTGPAAPTSLYSATSGSGRRVLSTHAVACRWLADRRVAVNGLAIPELVAFEYVGGRDTVVEGAHRVPVATRIRFGEAASEGSYWPAGARWARIPEPEAFEAAHDALLETLARRLADQPRPALGLTAGLDSLTTAVALRELGVPFSTFTWDHAPQDVAGAAALAQRLGVEHEVLPTSPVPAADVLADLSAGFRATEGAGQVTGLARLSWPARASAFVTGAGGETGRAFYYRWLAENHADPDVDDLLSAWRPDTRLRLAPRSVRHHVRGRARAWLESADAVGLQGWRALDFVYGECRLTGWGRGMMVAPVPTVAAFAHPSVQAGLCRLPLPDRLGDGFHRRFVRRYLATAPLPGPPALQRQGVPRVLRRVGSRVRRLREEHRASGAVDPTETLPGFPVYRQWLVEEVLESRIVGDVMGRRWVRATRGGVLTGSAPALEAARLASGPVALDAALSELKQGRCEPVALY